MEKEKIQTIRNKIHLIEKYSNQKCNFNKMVNEKEVLKFENKFDLKLPKDYRDFIIQVGNGGFMNLNFLNINHYIHRVSKSDRISEKFPLKKALIDINENEDLEEHVNIGDYDFLRLQELNFDFDELYNGQIILKNTGCGNYIFLVIKGAEYGNVWIWEYPSNGEILPYNGKKWSDRFKSFQRKSFSDWLIEELNQYLLDKNWLQQGV
ncbi:SMI1/KNR4 family protein [Winogradskyella sp. SYSU M77433]|uniref:SMI1/KNR4 family protein n=1 Tax=Winogradskyella sp. SYSU M77433 TaxID=3042722 RepID=UPI0024804A34|nr:SMI1/KNR4 family protein [Winogradskyella sp. SYSU M77433]MDH7911542.1 SMI1/KNR4 family protein [Winogradskyella sp. SYSU M77433]